MKKPPVPSESNLSSSEKAIQEAISHNSNVHILPTGLTFKTEEPLPLDIHLSSSTPFPINALPIGLRKFVYKIHSIVKAPLAMCAQCVLSAIALIAQSHANILMDGRRHPVSLFFLTVGESGERKSAVDKIVLAAIQEHEKELHALYEQELERYKMAVDHNNSLFKKDKRDASVNIEKPIEPIILVQEPTYEGLVKAYENGQPSLGLYSSEGGRFMGGHAMNKDNRIKTAAGFSDLWGGEPISVSRSEKGNKKFYDKRLSLHLMFQPKIAFSMFGDTALLDQGFLARCLIAYPDSTMGDRTYTEENIYNTKEYKSYSDKILNLISTKPVYIKGSVFRDIKLSKKAKKVAIKFHDEIESGLGSNGIYREISGFAAKALEHACRLAGVIGLYKNPLLERVNSKTMENAICLTRFYLTETARLINPYEKIEDKKESEIFADAKKLYDWIVISVDSEKRIKLRTIQRLSPRPRKDKVMLLSLLNVLVENGWLNKCGSANEWSLIDKN